MFCLSARRDDDGAIVYVDLESVFGDLAAHPPIYPVAPSFDAFISSLKPLS